VSGVAAIGLIWSKHGGAIRRAMTDEMSLMTLPGGWRKNSMYPDEQYLAINQASENKEAAALFHQLLS
jgi:hypothetical protein